jgi:RNA polymerase-binding transcription factor DksA
VAKTKVKKPSNVKSRPSGGMLKVNGKTAIGKKSLAARKPVVAAKPVIKTQVKPSAKLKPALATRNDRPSTKAAPASKSVARAESSRNTAIVSPVVVDAGVANGKPKKNPAGFSPRDLDHFRELLVAKRREILGDLRSMEHEALRTGGNSNLSTLPIHMADMGTDNYEQEFTLGLVEKDRQLLREINSALMKIQGGGTFGICEGTGKPINRERLEYQPWARFSIEYARKIERASRPGGIL